MSESEYNAAFVPATCMDCGAKLSVPLLSDFAYGQFIYKGENGRTFAYLHAIGDPTWDEIRDRLLAISGLTKIETDDDVDKFQSIVASCADKIEGERLQREWHCPKCASTSVDVFDVPSPLFKDIPCVTFSEFQALSADEKNDLLTRLWNRRTEDKP